MPPKRTSNKKSKKKGGKQKESSSRDIHNWAETGRVDAKGHSKSTSGVADAIHEGSLKPSEVPKLMEEATLMEDISKDLPRCMKDKKLMQLDCIFPDSEPLLRDLVEVACGSNDTIRFAFAAEFFGGVAKLREEYGISSNIEEILIQLEKNACRSFADKERMFKLLSCVHKWFDEICEKHKASIEKCTKRPLRETCFAYRVTIVEFMLNCSSLIDRRQNYELGFEQTSMSSTKKEIKIDAAPGGRSVTPAEAMGPRNTSASAAGKNATAISPGSFPGVVNPLDLKNIEEALEWMNKGRIDAVGLAKYFPHTAQDLQDGKISPAQLLESLGPVYSPPDEKPTEKQRIEFLQFLGFQIALVAIPESWFDGKDEPREQLITGFGKDLAAHLSKPVKPNMTSYDHERQAFRTTCAEWSGHLDSEVFGRRRGSFLRRCPLLLNSEEFDQVMEESIAKAASRNVEYDFKFDSIRQAALAVAEGAHDVLNTCWECEERSQSLSACSACQIARYCSRECQTNAWKSGHKTKCKDLKVMHGLFLESIDAIDAAHKTGELHGFQLNARWEYELTSAMFNIPIFDEEGRRNHAESEVPAGPSMVFFYENLGRVMRGEWWVFDEPDSVHDYETKCEDHSMYCRCLGINLCYDYFGFAAAKYGVVDPAKVISISHGDLFKELGTVFGVKMPPQVFLECFKKAPERRTTTKDRARLRRHHEVRSLAAFRGQFHK